MRPTTRSGHRGVRGRARGEREADAGSALPRRLHDLLPGTVEEAVRLLRADGGMIYLVEPDRSTLRLSHDVGITDRQGRRWARGLRLPLGAGMFGKAASEETLEVTDDYKADASFSHTPEADRVVDQVGIRAMIVAPLVSANGAIGALGVFSHRPAAFSDADAALVRALADHAASTITNARLIDELAGSRRALGVRAERERALREIGERLAGIHDPRSVLERVVHEAGRLVRADGTILAEMGSDGMLHWGYDDGVRESFDPRYVAELTLEVGVGVTGRAIAQRHAIICNEGLIDAFPRSPESDHFFEVTGYRSMIGAPILGKSGPLGALEVYSSREGAFDEADASIISALADQAAVAITNARLIEELATSREQVARRAERERTLGGLVAQLAAIRDPEVLLPRIVDTAAGLAGAECALLDRIAEDGTIVAGYNAGIPAGEIDALPETGSDAAAGGIMGQAIARRAILVTDDYLTDPGFLHVDGSDGLVRRIGMRSVVAAPLLSEDSVVGVLAVFSSRRAAFDSDDAALIGAFADHAAIAVANAGLIEALRTSRKELALRAETERTLREVVAELAAIRDPDVLLSRIVSRAAGFAGAQGALLGRIAEDGSVLSGYHAGVSEQFAAVLAEPWSLPPGAGIMGLAIANRRVEISDDYLVDGRFERVPRSDEMAQAVGIRSMAAAPLMSEGRPLGVLAVFSDRPGAFTQDDVARIAAFADHAAIALANAGLIEELRTSRTELARRAETERSLREITGRITSLADPDAVLQQVVDETQRLLNSDGAHLTFLEEGGRFLAPVVVAGGDDAMAEWLKTQQFPVGGGINGLAAQLEDAVWTPDYLVDPRLPHEPDDQEVAARLGLRAVAVAPLHAAGGGVLGTLAVSYRTVREISDEEIGLLSALADQAAIVVANIRLYDRLRESEERFRGLLAASPDIVFTVDAEGRFTFLSDTVERLLGWKVADVVGRHFGAIIDEGSMGAAGDRWRELRATPGVVLSARFDLIHVDGRRIPFEIRSAGMMEQGAFVGVQGAARDISERVRLEQELRDSERRYRTMVQTSPDGVWDADATGLFTFWSERATALYGWTPDQVVGRHWSIVVAPEWVELAQPAWATLREYEDRLVRVPLTLLHADGRRIPSEVAAVSVFEHGEFAGAHGLVRDVSERERLERELRESEARFRYLVENSPDIIWSADADGIFTYLSDTSERLLGWPPEELKGRHFAAVIHPESMEYVQSQYATSLETSESRDLQYRFVAQHRDGSRIPLEMHARTIVDDGRYRGVHGSVRDLRERERLERDLRRQASELAASEERAHLARELHDSVTQALFSMTLVTRSIELLLKRDPEAAAAKMEMLRDLQRDALAEMRALIFELRPASLETDGLVPALRTHAAAVQGRTGLPVLIEADDDADRLPPDLESVLFRCAQEALHNVVKHAGAHHVRLSVSRDQRHARVTVEDDGVGFDPSKVPAGHLGLAGMRARAEKAGGRLEVRTGHAQGTTILIEIPIEPAAGSDAGGPEPMAGAATEEAHEAGVAGTIEG